MNITADTVAEGAIDQPVTLESALASEGRADDQGLKVHVIRALDGRGRVGQIGPDQHFNLLRSHAGIEDRRGEARDYR